MSLLAAAAMRTKRRPGFPAAGRRSAHLILLALAGAACGEHALTDPALQPSFNTKVTTGGYVHILPADTSLLEGQTVQLVGTFVAPSAFGQPNREIIWASTNPDVATVSASGLVTAVAPGGVTITGTVGSAIGTATVTIGQSKNRNTPPQLTVTTPENDATFEPGTWITFTATATDHEDGDLGGAVMWTWAPVLAFGGTGPETPLGHGTPLLAQVPPGMHVITARVSDKAGLLAVAQFTIRIVGSGDTAPPPAPPPEPPRVTILAPLDASAFERPALIELAATADDEVDGDLTGAIEWYLLGGAGIETTLTRIGTGGTATLLLNEGFSHHIIARVTNSLGVFASTGINVWVVDPGEISDGPVSVWITGPDDGAVFASIESITFTGVGYRSPVTLSDLVWTATTEGTTTQLGTGNPLTTSLAVGTHLITLTATAHDGASGSASITVVVEDYQPPVANADEFEISLPPEGVLLDVLANDFSPQGSELLLEAVSEPRLSDARVSIENGHVRYRLLSPVYGTDRFSYSVTDGLKSSTAHVDVVIVNAPPVAVDDHFVIRGTHVNVLDVLANDYDLEGSPLSIVSTVLPGAVIEDGVIRYRWPYNSNSTAPSSARYRISDGQLRADGFTHVTWENHAPIAGDGPFDIATGWRAKLPISMFGRDPDGDSLRIRTISSTGSVQLENTYAHTAAPRMIGLVDACPASLEPPALVTYEVSDGVLTYQGAITIAVVNHAPQPAPHDTVPVPWQVGSVLYDAAAAATDVDPVTLAWVQSPPTKVFGTQIIGGKLRLTIVSATSTPPAPLTVGYRISDGCAESTGSVVFRFFKP